MYSVLSIYNLDSLIVWLRGCIFGHPHWLAPGEPTYMSVATTAASSLYEAVSSLAIIDIHWTGPDPNPLYCPSRLGVVGRTNDRIRTVRAVGWLLVLVGCWCWSGACRSGTWVWSLDLRRRFTVHEHFFFEFIRLSPEGVFVYGVRDIR